VTELLRLSGHRLLCVTTPVALDGRISWVPSGTRGFSPSNVYVLRQAETAVVVDTGLAAHRGPLIEALSEALSGVRDLQVLLTRVEPDCTGNLRTLVDEFPVSAVLTSSDRNPLEHFGPLRPRDAAIELRRIRPGDSIELASGRSLTVIEAPIRTLATAWLYDPASAAVLTSDLFTHSLLDCPTQDVEGHLLAKFDWLRYADCATIGASLETVFKDTIKVIAPGHGRPFVGEQLVRSQVGSMMEALSAIASRK
jgi:glyoxylase-like metal-dependent hydrolase (beta-lactamase superfamily II)